MAFNGPSRKIDEDYGRPELVAFLQNSAGVYCTECGTVYITADGRDCPACTLAEQLADIEERLDRAERDIDIIDGGI